MTATPAIHRTRESDPMTAARRLMQTRETLLACRGHHRSGTAHGPAARIMRDNVVRLLVVSQRETPLGFDD